MKLSFLITVLLVTVLSACSTSKKIVNRAAATLTGDSTLSHAQVGIAIYDGSSNRYLFRKDAEKFFVPASNTKIPTCYAAMKFLGDSLPGIYYKQIDEQTILLRPAADPSFLHPDFAWQPVKSFLQSQAGKRFLFYWEPLWKTNGLGSGWSWSDFIEPYMAERSPFPLYGNLVKIRASKTAGNESFEAYPGQVQVAGVAKGSNVRLERKLGTNHFFTVPANRPFDSARLTLGNLHLFEEFKPRLAAALSIDENRLALTVDSLAGMEWKTINSQPTDTLLSRMMHRSDNFFAEQALLMVSNKLFGMMDEERLIDSLQTSLLSGLPQQPRWVDGSGLSRYNLFSPADLVQILNRMENEFGMDRLKAIFPTGNEGTLNQYYTNASGAIYAKTGTLSGVVALSGFLYTKHNRLLQFSVLVNNHNGSASAVRRAVEKFIEQVRDQY